MWECEPAFDLTRGCEGLSGSLCFGNVTSDAGVYTQGILAVRTNIKQEFQARFGPRTLTQALTPVRLPPKLSTGYVLVS
jgi:hypothetical protein